MAERYARQAAKAEALGQADAAEHLYKCAISVWPVDASQNDEKAQDAVAVSDKARGKRPVGESEGGSARQTLYLHYARWLGPSRSAAEAVAAAAKDVDLTAEEAIAHAADEELELVPGSSDTGYKCVRRKDGRYQVRITENGKQSLIGCFGTAEHAALHYARWLGPSRSAAEAVAAAAASGHSRKRRADAPAETTSRKGRIIRAPSCREKACW